MFDRFKDRLGAATMATLGSNRAKGKLLLLNGKAHLRKEWDQYLGVRGGEPTMAAWISFARKYGVDLSDTEVPLGVVLNADRREALFEVLAQALIEAGMFDFGE